MTPAERLGEYRRACALFRDFSTQLRWQQRAEAWEQLAPEQQQQEREAGHQHLYLTIPASPYSSSDLSP